MCMDVSHNGISQGRNPTIQENHVPNSFDQDSGFTTSYLTIGYAHNVADPPLGGAVITMGNLTPFSSQIPINHVQPSRHAHNVQAARDPSGNRITDVAGQNSISEYERAFPSLET